MAWERKSPILLGIILFAAISISISAQNITSNSAKARNEASKREIANARISVLINKKNWEKISEYGATAAEPLMKSLNDNDVEIRMKSAEVLGIIGDKKAVEPLIGLLSDKDWHVRQQAAKALGKLRDSQTTEPLVECLKDSSKEVRREVVEALKSLADERAFEPLLQSLKDADPSVRGEAVKALLTTGGEKTVEPFMDYLNDSGSLSKVEVIRALGVLGDKRAVGQLVICLKDKDAAVRMWSAESLGRIVDKRAVEPLKRCLEDPDESVRIKAAEALRKFHVEVKPAEETKMKVDRKTEAAAVPPPAPSQAPVPADVQPVAKTQEVPASKVEAVKKSEAMPPPVKIKRRNSSAWWIYGIIGGTIGIFILLLSVGAFSINPFSVSKTPEELGRELDTLASQIREICRKKTSDSSKDAALNLLEAHATAFSEFPSVTGGIEEKRRYLDTMDESIPKISEKLGSGHRGIKLLMKMQKLVKNTVGSGSFKSEPAD